MAKIYVSNFKAYLAEIDKLQVDFYTKTDQLVPLEPQHLRTFLTQSKPTAFNQEKRSIFALMGRDRIIEQNE
jgi:ABC-type Zn uptake system ZnuABC Zn-binding protein ZnuA